MAPAVVAEMEGVDVDAQPAEVAGKRHSEMGLAPSGWADHTDEDPAGVVEPPGLGGVELRRADAVAKFMDAIQFNVRDSPRRRRI